MGKIRTQPQHTTHNMSRRHPTLQRLLPSLSMATSAMDPNLGAAAPMDPYKARGIGCALAIVGFFVWGAKRNPSKNRDRDGVSALGGRRLNIRCNNQPKVCNHSEGIFGMWG